MFLTAEQIEALTKKRRWAAQVRALARMGIPHRVRGDGSPVVTLSAVEPAGAVTMRPEPRLRLPQ